MYYNYNLSKLTNILCLFQARTWISKVICHFPPFFLCSVSSWDVIVCFVGIGEIVDHHCLNFLFIIFGFKLDITDI